MSTSSHTGSKDGRQAVELPRKRHCVHRYQQFGLTVSYKDSCVDGKKGGWSDGWRAKGIFLGRGKVKWAYEYRKELVVIVKENEWMDRGIDERRNRWRARLIVGWLVI
jgi:hypothetical protein